jgi:hypothetical protein
MYQRRMSIEQGLFLLAFLLALFFRLVHLGAFALSDAEASLAMQALQIARGEVPPLGSQPGYVLLTGVLFFLFGSNNALARLAPALLGSLIVLLPVVFRPQLGRRTALVLAYFLALSPTLIAVTRTADGKAIGLTFLLLALGLALRRQAAWAGICAGLALLGGPSVWLGLLGLAVAGGFSIPVVRSLWQGETKPAGRDFWIRLAAAGLITFLAVGTLFLQAPHGISAAASSLVSFLSGWIAPATQNLGLLLAALAGIEILPLALGLVGAISRSRGGTPVETFLIRWLVIASVLLLLYPGRQVADLAWVLIPLYILAAGTLDRWLASLPEMGLVGAAQAGFVFALLAFVVLNYLGTYSLQELANLQLRWISMAGALIILVLLGILIAWSWSVRIAMLGTISGTLLLLAVFNLSNTFNAGGIKAYPQANIYQSDGYFQEADLLLQTVNDISRWSTGDQDTLGVTLVGMKSPAIEWLLRNAKGTHEEDFLSPSSSPAMVVSAGNAEITLGSNYSGQDFVASERPAWSLMSFGEWVSWLVYRDAPLEKTAVILWVRNDLFPGANPAVSQP